ncbi:Fe(3+) dicitrate ABC transporter substrate-binding protein [Bacillus zhangzhouensis]|nr:Fe(3+) dicitrate ABC transporter substrate-binding protein [Bacillus zhangzhouensis]
MMKQKMFLTVSLLLAFVLIASGCQKGNDSKSNTQETSSESFTIKHDLGVTKLNKQPKRIVVLELSFLDAINELGLKPVGVADDNKKDMIFQLVGKTIDYTSVGTRAEPNLEVISSLKPDLIIADSQRHKAIYQQLTNIAPTIELKSRESTYSEQISALKTIAKATYLDKKGKSVLSKHEQTMASLHKKLPKAENRTIMLGVARKDSFNIHTNTSYDGEILEKLGFQHAVTSDEAYKDVSLEQLSKIDPDILFISKDDIETILDKWETNPIWKNLKAVKKGQVYEGDRNLYTRFRGVGSSEIMAKDILKQVYKKD